MKEGRCWWVTIGEKSSVKICLCFEYWNPLDKLEVRRSIGINRLCNQSTPFISVVVAFLFVKFEWYLYIK